MATAKTNKARNEVEKARLKLAEQQTKLKELEARQTECENLEIVDIVRGLSIPLDNLAGILQSLKGGAALVPPTGQGQAPPAASGQPGPKPATGKKANVTDTESEENDDQTDNEI